jgi:hypothetical protein
LENFETKSQISVLEKMELTSNGVPAWTIENLEFLVSQHLLTGTSPLSPYPKTYEENLRWRTKILRRAAKDEVFRKRVKKLFFEDILFAYNLFYWTLDVRRKPNHHRPFATYWYQDLAILHLVDAITHKRDLVDEKSRDMGISWIFVGTYVWFWLKPEGGADFLLGSRIADYVDKKGDMRTLFEKIRYLLYRLPKWLLPKGFNRNKHDNFMKIVNPESGSALTGESNNANFGTGGRYSGVLLDEFSKWEVTDEAAWTSLGDATPSRHAIGTPFGAGGKHYELVTDGKTNKLVIHWSLHPLKNARLACIWPKPAEIKKSKKVDFLHWKGLTSPWYEAELLRRSSREISQELDIDYIGAGQIVFEDEAMQRIQELMRIERPIQNLYSFDYGLNELVPVEKSIVRDLEGYLVVYDWPTERSLEVAGVDVAEGLEHGDYSVMKIMERHSRNLVMSYYGRTSEVAMARIIAATSKMICARKQSPDQFPWFVIETIGPGISTFDLCMEWNVTNLFMMPRYDSAKDTISYTKGMRTNATSKNVGIAKFRTWLEEHQGWIDARACRECTTFVRDKNGRPGAKTNCNDDEVMAWLLALMGDSYLPAIDYSAPAEPKTPYEVARELMQQEAPARREPTLEELAIETVRQQKLVQLNNHL